MKPPAIGAPATFHAPYRDDGEPATIGHEGKVLRVYPEEDGEVWVTLELSRHREVTCRLAERPAPNVITIG